MKTILTTITILCTFWTVRGQEAPLEGRIFRANVLYVCAETPEPSGSSGAVIDMVLAFQKDKVCIRLTGYEYGELVDEKLEPLNYRWDMRKVIIPGLRYNGEPLLQDDELVYENDDLNGFRTGSFTGYIIFSEVKADQ